MTRAASIGAPPVRSVLAGGRRHFQHGPIDLVIEALGAPDEVGLAYEQAWTRFQSVLAELVDELTQLRQPVRNDGLQGPIALAMRDACAAHKDVFVTPMAAVAGAVADAVLAALTAGRRLKKAYVNNGGDIALYLAPGQSFRTGIVTLGETPSFDGRTDIAASSGVRGIATSGWRGRSYSLGIADSVTVLAANAAMADVAATLIANAVDLEDAAIKRAPAVSLDPDSDLGGRPVTIEVCPLPPDCVERALANGICVAEKMIERGLIAGALLTLQDRSLSVGCDGASLGTDRGFIVHGMAGLPLAGGIEARN